LVIYSHLILCNVSILTQIALGEQNSCLLSFRGELWYNKPINENRRNTVKRTFTTIMPDQIGAFLKAARCVSALGLNITRVSYNKAVDIHTLFIEVEGSEEQLDKADRELTALGYINGEMNLGNVLLLEFQLDDHPGTLVPVLELIDRYSFNISYISSQENKTDHQYFKMGLFVENGREVSEFLQQASQLCPIRVLHYSSREKLLDNTVFYITFANDIAWKLGLPDADKRELILNANRIMQMLDERNSLPYKTFEYIGLFAEMIRDHRGDGYRPIVTRHKTAAGAEILSLEPPCGSNTAVLNLGDTLLFIDSGFSCYQNEQWSVLEREIRGFSSYQKEMLLTHADADHVGLIDRMEKIYLNRACLLNFRAEQADDAAIREENPLHAPYARISKILIGYRPPKANAFTVVGEQVAEADVPLKPIGTLPLGDFNFELYGGSGGHVRGEMVIVERRHRIVFTGDIFVNIKGFSKEQAAFNRLAPYLMTSVDTDPQLAKAEREAIWALLDAGEWTVFSGHGAPCTVTV